MTRGGVQLDLASRVGIEQIVNWIIQDLFADGLVSLW